MAKNGKDTKHTRYINRRMHFVRNGEECNMHKTVWYEGGLQLSDIETKNIREDELNPRLGYDMVRLDNWKNTCTRGVIGYIIFLKTMFLWMTWLDWVDNLTQRVWNVHMSLEL